MADAVIAALLTGFALGWSVAWPPGPINAEAIRRALAHRVWPAYCVVLGGCIGDALWALVVGAGAAQLRGPRVQHALGWISVVLLLILAAVYVGRVLNPSAAAKRPPSAADGLRTRPTSGVVIGLTLALTSPWNITFWTAVMAQSRITASAVVVAAGVIAGAATWGAILCLGVNRLAKAFAHPLWEVLTNAATGALMLFFAIRTLLSLS